VITRHLFSEGKTMAKSTKTSPSITVGQSPLPAEMQPDRRTLEGRYSNKPTDIAGEFSDRQDVGLGLSQAFAMQGAWLWANGGKSDNPMGFPGYDRVYDRSISTYRWMLQHPVLRLVRFISTAPILASTWNYEKVRKNASDEWGQKLEQTFNPLRFSLCKQMSRGMDYGWLTGEPIWEIRDDLYWLTRVKPLLHDITQVLRNRKGHVVGARQMPTPYGWVDQYLRDQQTRRNLNLTPADDNVASTTKPIDLPAPFKLWHWAYDSEGDDPYGRSWLESCRETCWKGWLDTAQQLQKTGAKISGMVTIITSPAGTFPDGKGGSVSYRENAETFIKALANGAVGGWFPSLGLAPDSRGSLDAMKVLVELAGKSLINVDVKDFGSHAQAISGFLERMRHEEELMFAARGRSPRVAMEGKHGTKAEAGVHTDSSITVAEIDGIDIAEGVQPLIDADLVLNYGERARGAYRVRQPSMADRKSELYRTILLSGINDPGVANELFSSMNIDLMMKALDIDMKKPFDGAALKEYVKARLQGSGQEQKNAQDRPQKDKLDKQP
jgi:hypothetical protein